MKKRITGLCIAVCGIMLASAQSKDSTITRNIQIERNYVPEVMEAKRMSISPSITEPTIDKIPAYYSDYSSLIMPPPVPLYPVAPAQLSYSNREAAKPGFARLGVGAAFTWLADIWYPIINNRDGYFDIGLHHNGIATVSKSDRNKQLYNTRLYFNFVKNFNAGALYLSAGYNNEAFNYYGNDSLRNDVSRRYINTFENQTAYDSLLLSEQSLNRATVAVGFRNRNRSSGGWLYDAGLNYHLLTTRDAISEHQIVGHASMDVEWEQHQIKIDGEVRTFFYKTPYSDGTFFLNYNPSTHAYLPNRQSGFISSWKPNAVVAVLPAYLFNRRGLNLRLGVKTWLNFGKGSIVAASPDIKAGYTLSNLINIYAGITGDYRVNSLDATLKENRYYAINLPTLHNSYTPFDLFAGFNLRPLTGLMIEGSISYQMVRNQQFFYNQSHTPDNSILPLSIPGNTFTADYANGTVFYGKARIAYNHKERFNIHAQMLYNVWQLDNASDSIAIGAWHRRGLEIGIGADLKFAEKWIAGINYFYGSKTSAKIYAAATPTLITLPAVNDLNLSLSYVLNQQWSLFAQLNNVIAISPKYNYQYWNGY
ncbi:MAG: hypothetical protein LBS16_01820, partial [Prevotellaceae bacterium]|nr:hypothetical protein [Prevotellaceae bacterium]